MNIVLYYAPHTCALAPYVTLTEAGADFTVQTVNLRKKQQFSPEYLKINPKHKVPALIVDGRALSENVAIHPWVARNFPKANLLPADPWEELKALSIHSWCSGGIHPFLARVNNPAKVCTTPGSEESVVKEATAVLHENFAVADEMLKGREFFFGHFTTPDAHFFWCVRRAGELGVDTSQFANVRAHFDRMRARDSVKKVEAFEASVLADFAKAS
jgi:glutathione S-transferase